MVRVANRPFGALKDLSFSVDMTHQKGPPATARGVSWGRCDGTDNVTNQPAHDARPSSLHRRLTVALANASDRARLAELLAGDLSSIGTDADSPLLRSEDLWQAADGVAVDHAGDRDAVRARLDAVVARTMHDCDTARHQLEHLNGRVRTLRDGAEWAIELHEGLPDHLGAVEAARDALDARRAEQRAAQQDLERVLEQRAAAAAAIEQADSELAELVGSGMDESALRRELEAAGQAVRDAQQAHSAAQAKLERLQIEATGLQVRREAASPVPVARSIDRADPGLEAIADVRDALAAMQSVMIDGEVDRTAEALAAAWIDLHADLEQLGDHDGGPSVVDLDQARARLATAVAAIAELDAEASAGALTPEQRAELDAAHTAVLEAEENVGGRWGGASARRQLEHAQAAERALLDQYGFGGYLDVVLTGGRASAVNPARDGAERELYEAKLALDALERAGQTAPEIDHLRAERDRLLEQITDLLGVDPGDAVVPLLRAHRPVARALRAPLEEAMAAVGVRPVGISLDDAAMAFLQANPLPEDDAIEDEDEDAAQREHERQAELAAVEERWAAIEDELRVAEAEVDRTAKALDTAERSVDAFEGELTVRAGEDAHRLQRFAAAEQLRAQIESVAGTLRRAEEDARAAVDGAARLVAAAEAGFEQSATVIGDLARRVRKLAEELPIHQRPEGDPLESLLDFAESLREHAEVLQPEIDRAEAAVAAASVQMEEALAERQLAGDANEGPRPEDLVEGLQGLLDEPSDSLLVLDEPFVGVDQATRAELLEIVRTSSAHRQIVLLTDDADVLGWAIELPVDEAAAVPADALFAPVRAVTTDLRDAPEPAAFVAAAVDITELPSNDPDPEPEPAPTARRWAGQR
jgi:hypothetical protein